MMRMPKIVIDYDYDMLVLLLLIRTSGAPSRVRYKKPTVSQPYVPTNEQDVCFCSQ